MVQYNEELNKEIRRTVRNFNAKVRRNKTKTRGKGMLPRTISTADIKAKYSDKPKADLLKQLKLYQSFGKRDALDKITESRISKWELEFFKANKAKTEEFYNKEIADLNRIVGGKPEYYLKQHNRLQTLESKREFLDKDLSTLDEDQIKIMRSVYGYAERSEEVKRQGFRLYLTQLERLMELRNIPKSQREALLSKFDVLSENEFIEMVRNETIIDRIYDLVNSPEKRGEYELTVDDANADAILRELWNNVDDIIAKYNIQK